MKRMLAIAALGLTTAVAAQVPNTLTPAAKGAGVEVMFGTTKVTKVLPDTAPITKMIRLTATSKQTTSRYYDAHACFTAGTFSGGHMRYGGTYAGARFTNHGFVKGDTTNGGYAKGLAQNFTWNYGDPKVKLNGTLKVYFSGYAYDGAMVSATIGKDTFKNDVQKPGRFAFKKEYPITDALGLAEVLALTADSNAVAKDKKASYSASFSLYFYPTVATKTLTWSAPTQTSNCAAGAIGTAGTVALGKKFDITLTGANDTGAVKEPVAMLFMGSNVKNWFFLPLPMDLTGFGAKGCELRLAIVGSKTAKIDTTTFKATFPFMVSSWYRYHFKTTYFQIGYMTDANTLGMVFTDYGMLEVK